MNDTIMITRRQISITVDPGGESVLAALKAVPAEDFDGIGEGWVIEYAVEPAEDRDPRAPEPKIDITFPMEGVSRIQLSTDFKACGRTGMHYDSRLDTHAMGYEPYAMFADCTGKNICFAGAGNLELSGSVRADCYGKSPQGTMAESFAHVRMARNGVWERTGGGGRIFRERIYLDTSNEEAHEVIGRYFTWLGRRYDEGQRIPEWGDGVQWHSWYAFGMDFDGMIIERQSELAGALGIGRIHIDCGWDVSDREPCNSGKNTPDPVKFPDFRGLVDLLHGRGQRVSLRWTPFMLHPDNDLGKELYSCRIIPEAVNPYGSYFYPCPRCAQTGEALAREAVRMAREYGIDELWFDMMDDFPELFGECEGDHPHLPGSAGENVVRIVGEIVRAVKKENPDFGITLRRLEITPVFRQFTTHAWPHDRYHDYLGNLRECLLVRKLVRHELVHNVCMCWNRTERPGIVANHMLTMIFGGVPAISVDLSAQSDENMRVLKCYIRLYTENKKWLNPAKRVILCPEDSIRAIRIDAENESWILCTGTPPGRIELPESVERIRIFCTSCHSFDALLPVYGKWKGVMLDCFLEETGRPRIEKLAEGMHVGASGTPLFCIDLLKSHEK